MTLTSFKIVCATMICGGGTVAVLVIGNVGSGPTPFSPPPIQEPVHTAAWYVAHPDIAKEDEARCGNNAASISMAACQNDASAENTLLEQQLGTAATVNANTAIHTPQKSP